MIRLTMIVALLCVGRSATAATELGIEGTQFTVNSQPTFLLGMSYYGALGASREFIQQDLDDMQESGFNWIRVWRRGLPLITTFPPSTNKEIFASPFLTT